MIYVDRKVISEKLNRLECHAHLLELAHRAPSDSISYAAQEALSMFSGEMAVVAQEINSIVLVGAYKPEITLKLKPKFKNQITVCEDESIHEREMRFRKIAKEFPDWFE